MSEATKEAVDFRRAQLEIETILPKNAKLTAGLVNELEELSKQYGTTATVQAKAYYEIISAGVNDAADGAKLLARANALATGGVTDTANTIDLLTTIYNVYGKEVATAAEASDSLFKTVQIGKTTIAELSQDLGQALPIAKSFGIGLDEVGAILAQLTNSGISTAESVTLLNAVLSAIAKNGDKLGVGFNSAAVQTEGLGVVLERLKERTNGSNDALFDLLGRQEAVRAVQSLTAKGLDNYNNILAEYSNKAGVAAEASQKIIDNDIGKQFDILGPNIGSVARSFIDVFIPATLAATKAVNNFFSNQVDSNTAEQGLERTRRQIERLKSEFEKGKIPVEDYERSIRFAEQTLANFSKQVETASTPLTLLSTGLQKEADNIRAQIGSLKNGFDELSLGPIERDLKIEDLNAKLSTTVAKIKELSSINDGVSNDAVIAPVNRSAEAIANELKLQAELRALRIQFATEEQSFQDQLVLADMDAKTTQNELITTQIYDQKIREAEAAYQGELTKNQLIKDAQEQKAANDIAFQKREEAMIKAGNTKALTDTKAAKSGQLALEQSFQNSRNTLIGQGFQLAATIARDGSRAQFLIQKAAALAEIAIGDGKARALIPAQTALIPFPANIAAAASLNAYVTAQTALGAAIVGASTIKGFADGGIVGATSGPDNRVATVRDGEIILNASQQQKLFNMIENGSGGGGTINLVVDGRTLATVIRDQIQSGFRMA
jgi:TP901 family phage tail tape measure protein